MRSRGGGRECRLRVDANMAMTIAEDAICLIERREPWDIELLEQPVGPKACRKWRQSADRRRHRIWPMSQWARR